MIKNDHKRYMTNRFMLSTPNYFSFILSSITYPTITPAIVIPVIFPPLLNAKNVLAIIGISKYIRGSADDKYRKGIPIAKNLIQSTDL